MEIRPWRCGDDVLATAIQPHLSESSLSHRFLAGTGGRLPAAYLRHIAAGPSQIWDAQVSAGDGQLYGWAEFGRLPGEIAVADLAVLVADPWQRQGLATAMIRALLPRAAAAGVTTIHADVLPSNRAAHGLLRSLFGERLHPEFADGIARYEVALSSVHAPELVGVAR
jgi:RimJ/RimL family protein N-acetyltransferase